MGKSSDIVLLNQTYQGLSESFYIYLGQLGYQDRSNKVRYSTIREFLAWSDKQNKPQIDSIQPIDIKNYYGYISHRPNKVHPGILSPQTTHAHMRTIKDFFVMLQHQGQITSNPCSTPSFTCPKQDGSTRQILTQEEIILLYQSACTLQQRAILSLAYGCGLRADELEKCNTGDIRLQEKTVIIPQGKGGKKRIIPLSSGVVKDLGEYYCHDRELLKLQPFYRQSQTAFMLNSRGGRMRKWSYNRYLKQIIERTGNESLLQKQITIHSLRHSIASHLLEQGVKIEQVRLFLGHSQLETTQIYTHISRQQLKKLIE